MATTLLTQTYNYDSGGSAAFGLIFGLVGLAFGVFFIVTFWRLFEKAGYPGWAAIIPVYNSLVLIWMAGKAWWWLLLYLIPIVNIILAIIVAVEIARRFGKSSGFAVGLIFLSFIFYPILAFGSATYQPDAAAA